MLRWFSVSQSVSVDGADVDRVTDERNSGWTRPVRSS
jgi:hypothetical protein